jgi:broad specificity phosphatase PhoE
MSLLHLVRHGLPDVCPPLPAHEWSLSVAARSGLIALRDSGTLPAKAGWFSSTEPKAIETARFLTHHDVATVDDLREQGRPAGWLDSERDWRLLVRVAFEHPQWPALAGWEPLDRTRRRVTSAVLRLIRGAGRSDLVAIGHGTAWTVLVSELTGCPPDLDAWEEMLMPDHCALDLDTGNVISNWGSWT